MEQLWNMAVTRIRSVKHRGPFFIHAGRADCVCTLLFRYTPTSRQSTQAHIFTPLRFIVYKHSVQVRKNILTALRDIAHSIRVKYITVYC